MDSIAKCKTSTGSPWRVAKCLSSYSLMSVDRNLKTVAISDSGHELGLEITAYFADSPVVILFIVERLYVHYHAVSAFMPLYSSCVPQI